MKIYDLIDKTLLDDMIAKKYINVQTHPLLGYKIYNYSKSCTLDHVWNDATEQCRGLITDADDNIIARPFRKFYNIEEIQDKSVIPSGLPKRIYDKVDGSLGIMYWDKNCHPYIATRGSFNSYQAEWASDFLINNILGIDEECELRDKLLKYHYSEDTGDILDAVKYTLLFEIVCPGDKHVVNYGDKSFLTLLAIIDNETGGEVDPENLDGYFDVVKSYDVTEDWMEIRNKYNGDNAEGFVVMFNNNFRLKMKYEQWFRKNFIINGLSRKKVLEFIVCNDMKGFASMLGILDEENRIYYRKMYLELMNMYHEIEYDAYMEYRDGFDTDKEAAEYFKTCKYKSILFSIRRGKDYSMTIWKMIKEMIKERPESNVENDNDE